MIKYRSLCAFFAVALSMGCIASFNPAKSEKAIQQIGYEKINLRDKLLEKYYDELDDTQKQTTDLDSFSKGYENSKLPIREYTDSVKSGELNVMRATNDGGYKWYQEMYDDYFMITDNHPDRRPGGDDNPNYYPANTYDKSVYYASDFYQEPNYDNEAVSAVYSLLNVGDIVMDPISRMDPINVVTHTGIIINTAKSARKSDGSSYTFVQTIEAEPSGVHFGFLDDDRILEYGAVVLRPQATYEQIQTAISFARAQVNKPYDLNIGINYIPGYNEAKWYCNELVWAAYYYAGVNICALYSGVYPAYDGHTFYAIGGTMIYNSYNVFEVGFYSEYNYPTVRLVRKVSNGWKIRITNYSNQDKPYYFSEKTQLWDTTLGDADQYTRNVKAAFIRSGQSIEVTVLANSSIGPSLVPSIFVSCYDLTMNPRMKFVTVLNKLHRGNSDTDVYCDDWQFGSSMSYYDSTEIHYAIEKVSNTSYVLAVENLKDSLHRIEYNAKPITRSNELDNWNLKYDTSEWTYARPKQITRINIGNQDNVYIREGNNGYVRRITYTDNVTLISEAMWKNVQYLKLSIIGKSGTSWRINVTNVDSVFHDFYWNKKMCNGGDAKNLTGLKDIAWYNIGLNPGNSKEITVSPNWFATHITFYYEDNYGHKYVSYADGLNNSNKTLNYYTNYIA